MRRLTRALAALAVSAVSAVSLGLTAPAQAQSLEALGSLGSSGSSELLGPDGSECAPNIVVNIPGGANSYAFLPQNYPHGGNTREVGTGLRLANPGRVIDRYASYNSTPGGLRSYYATRQNGYDRAWAILARDAEQCPDAKFSLFGYSMGADIASRMTQDIAFGRGPIPADCLSSAVFMANPNRGVEGVAQAGSASANTKGAFGALPGGYGDLTDRVLDICRSGDIVCETSDAASNMAKSLAKTAVLTSNLNMVETVTTYYDMTSHQRFIALPTLFAGWSTHNDYFTDGGPAIAMGFIQERLEEPVVAQTEPEIAPEIDLDLGLNPDLGLIPNED